MSKIFSSSGIVLKTVKYGETSVISTIYTSTFGIQTYIVKGIRKSKNGQAHLYQPGSLLDMQVYHNDMKNLQFVKECKWKVVYNHIFTNVTKNAIVQLMMEVVQKSLQDEEQNEPLFDFIENRLLLLDTSDSNITADIPVKFMAHLPLHLGFQIQNNYSDEDPYFSPSEGKFISSESGNYVELDKKINAALSQILSSNVNKDSIGINGITRRKILYLLEKFYQYQIDGFNECKTLRVIETLLS